MPEATDTDTAPWIVIRSNDNKRARINAMRYVLAKSDYDDKDYGVVGGPDPLIAGRALTDCTDAWLSTERRVVGQKRDEAAEEPDVRRSPLIRESDTASRRRSNQPPPQAR